MATDRPILTLKGNSPVMVELREGELRFVERPKTRYILQQCRLERSSSVSSTLVWRDVPLVRFP